eukprot:3102259-Rhodomonas_salina.1
MQSAPTDLEQLENAEVHQVWALEMHVEGQHHLLVRGVLGAAAEQQPEAQRTELPHLRELDLELGHEIVALLHDVGVQRRGLRKLVDADDHEVQHELHDPGPSQAVLTGLDRRAVAPHRIDLIRLGARPDHRSQTPLSDRQDVLCEHFNLGPTSDANKAVRFQTRGRHGRNNRHLLSDSFEDRPRPPDERHFVYIFLRCSTDLDRLHVLEHMHGRQHRGSDF